MFLYIIIIIILEVGYIIVQSLFLSISLGFYFDG